MADLEQLKVDSAYLAGDLADQLADADDAFTADATQLLKFHGTYQQDDRDVRKERQRAGLGREHSMMVRASIPGGVLDPDQYLACDRLADEVGNGTLRVTTRQGLQWHVVGKHDLPTLLGTLNEHLVTTLAACGDVSRNVMACSAPLRGREDLVEHATALAHAVRPRTSSYWDLWLDGERAVSAVPEPDAPVHDAAHSGDAQEPLYGPTYLPRKFKIGIVHRGDNCGDVYTNDIGLVPERDDAGRLIAFTVLVGGGLGMTHNKPATFPRLADPLATVAPDELIEVVTTILGVQRDHGDRDDRKTARMKYLVDRWGIERFRAEVESRLGRELPDPPALAWDQTHDHLGWHEQVPSSAGRDQDAPGAGRDQADGTWFLGLPIASGRIDDVPGRATRTALRELVGDLGLGVRFTARQDVLLTDVPADARYEVEQRLRVHGVPQVETLRMVERHGFSCPALPTCGLALTEAERVMPALMERFAAELELLGLGDAPVHLRMTGCPNGCARPYSTEIGVVGRGKDHYTVYLGGDALGTRLNAEFAGRIHLEDLVPLLSPVLAAWRDGRTDGEGFGDYCDRVGVETLAERFAKADA